MVLPLLVGFVYYGGGCADSSPTEPSDAATDLAPPEGTSIDPGSPDPSTDPQEGDASFDASIDVAEADGAPADAGTPDSTAPAPYGTFTPVRQDTTSFPTPPPHGYYVYLPSTYGGDPAKQWPTILFYPGTGERGNGTTELGKLLLRGLPKVIDQGKLPAPAYNQFIVIAAQNQDYPTVAQIDAFLGWLAGHYRIDPKRRYLTGLSAGGITTWAYGRNGGTQIAAYVPFSAKNGAGTACAFAHRPIWIFHGKNDSNAATPVSASVEAWNAVNACSPDEPARLSVITNGGHDDQTWVPIWDLTAITGGNIDPAYDPYNESIYSWLLDHHL